LQLLKGHCYGNKKLTLKKCKTDNLTHMATIIDFPNLGITYIGGWCSATISR